MVVYVGLGLALLGCRSVPASTATATEPGAEGDEAETQAEQRPRVQIESDLGAVVALSTEPPRMLTVSQALTIRIWDLETGKLLKQHAITRDPSQVRGNYGVGSSPRNRFVAISGGSEQAPLIIDMETGEARALEGEARVVAISEDGERIVRQDWDCEPCELRIESGTGDTLARVAVEDPVDTALLFDGGQRLLAARGRESGTLWSVPAGESLGEMPLWWRRADPRPRAAPARVHAAGPACTEWDPRRARMTRQLPGLARCRVLATSAGHERVALVDYAEPDSGGRRAATLRVWSASSDQVVLEAEASDDVTSASFDSSARWLILSELERSRVWDLDNPGDPPLLLDGALSNALGTNAARIVLAGYDEAQVLAKDGRLELETRVGGRPVFGPGERTLTFVGESPSQPSQLWSLAEGRRLAQLSGERGLASPRIQPGGERVLVAGREGAQLWSLAGGEHSRTCALAVDGAYSSILDLAWLDEASFLVHEDARGGPQLRAFRARDCAELGDYASVEAPDQTYGRRALFPQPGGDAVLVNLDRGAALLGGGEVRVVGSEQVRPWVGWSPDGAYFVRSEALGPAVFDERGQAIGSLGHSVAVDHWFAEAVALSAGGERVASLTSAGSILVHDVRSGAARFELEPRELAKPLPQLVNVLVAPIAVAYWPSGELLASLDQRGVFELVDPSGRRLETVEERVSAFAWSPTGKWLALARWQPGMAAQTVELYDTRTLETVASYSTHWAPVVALHFVGEARLLIHAGSVLDLVELPR